MKKIAAKKLKAVAPKKATKKVSAPRKSKKLTKDDPEFYAKIGAISAKKRKLSKEFFSEMARKSHENRTEYHGGRKKADA